MAERLCRYGGAELHVLIPGIVEGMPGLGRLVCLVLFSSWMLTAQPAQNAGYVGSTVCKSCHPDVSSAFFKNPHFKSIASGQEPGDHTGCEGCHGPGKAHVEARGGKGTIVAFSEPKPKQILDY